MRAKPLEAALTGPVRLGGDRRRGQGRKDGAEGRGPDGRRALIGGSTFARQHSYKTESVESVRDGSQRQGACRVVLLGPPHLTPWYQPVFTLHDNSSTQTATHYVMYIQAWVTSEQCFVIFKMLADQKSIYVFSENKLLGSKRLVMI